MYRFQTILAAVTCIAASPAFAATFSIQHDVLTDLTPVSSGISDRDADFSDVTYSDGRFPLNPDAVVAGIGDGATYESRAAIRPSGALAMSTDLGIGGQLTSAVGIDVTISTGIGETFDLSGFVIVDGGLIDTFDSADAAFSFDWSVAAGPLSGTFLNPVRTYAANAEISYDNQRVATATTSFSGSTPNAPGPVFDFEFITAPDSMSIEIPAQIVPFDFGTMPENSTWRISYGALLHSTVGGFTEGARMRFADPLMLDSQDPALQINFTPGTPTTPISPVPLPAGLPLLLSALAGCAALRLRYKA